ncbi:hypothetical protein [Sulfolobus tengchongensis spindle-shaped virus 3]|nr:hypothetical protein [Sulfolobus tengchongensis spindle-shaped virus 3]
MNIFYIILLMILLGVVVIIVLNVAVAIQDMYSTVLTLAGGSSSTFNASISPFAFWTIVFTILGFFVLFIVMIIYEKNR